jgi:cytochrome c
MPSETEEYFRTHRRSGSVASYLIRCGVAVALLQLSIGATSAQLRGHGGPVRALAISPDGKTAISGSFDATAIRWSLERDAADQVLRFHDGAVNAVALWADGRAATGGEDGRIAIWQPHDQTPQAVLEGHRAPVAGLAISADGSLLASASWDHTARLWRLAGGPARMLEGHAQNVNGVAFTPDGGAVVTAGYDATLRIWPLMDPMLDPASDSKLDPILNPLRNGTPIIVTLPTPLNAIAVAPEGDIVAAGADGKIYFLSQAGELRGEVAAASTPIVAIAVSPDGALIAAAGIGGTVAIIDRAARRVARTLIGPGLPVWSVAFFPDGSTLLTGGADRVIRRWNARSGEPMDVMTIGSPADPLAPYAGDPGAEVFRACVACHTLQPDQGNRAGPTLAGLFGRRIATLPGYNFSPALKALDIVWTPETVSKLFELGPATFTPGTKMPEQRIGLPAERAALVKFLQQATTEK